MSFKITEVVGQPAVIAVLEVGLALQLLLEPLNDWSLTSLQETLCSHDLTRDFHSVICSVVGFRLTRRRYVRVI